MTPDDWCEALSHGSRTAYFRGCRCTTSRALEAAYKRSRRADPNPRRLPAVGTHRRIRALYVMGWTGREIGARLGVTIGQVSLLHHRHPVVLSSTAAKVVAVYDELSMRRGPSDLTRAYALRQGWFPPLAWDDDTIDDPTAVPAVCVELATRTIDLGEVEFLTSCGETWSGVARRLGFSRASIETHLHRAGRLDIAQRLAQSSQGEYDLTRPKRRQWST